MVFPSVQEFLTLAANANLVPVWTSVPADLLTPVSAYLRLTGVGSQKQRARRNFSFLLESVEGGETIARYTYLGADPFLIFRYWLNSPDSRKIPGGKAILGIAEFTEEGRRRRIPGDILPMIRDLLARFRPARVEQLPPFAAGAVGYLGYDLVSLREPVPLRLEAPAISSPEHMPDALLMFFTTVLVFDHVKQQILIIRNVRCPDKTSRQALVAAYREAEKEIQTVEKKLRAPLPLPEPTGKVPKRRPISAVRSNLTKEQFVATVSRAKQYIRAGDIFQVVLSQRMETRIQVDPFQIYRALRRVNPAPYLFFLRLGKDCVLGSSPEMLVKVTGEEAEYRPIAGTRPRGGNPTEDKALEVELLADEKERAEHVMLVDLGRNDMGRVCRFGTVKVADLMFVERYSHVMHLVSSLHGKLRPELDAWDTLWACFPAGTVSGAPKVRAMQIISELEPTRRGVYAGAILYLDFSRNLNSCIAIRTIVISGGRAYVQAGAGIVADSVPEREYEETLNKGKALFKAIEMAQQERQSKP